VSPVYRHKKSWFFLSERLSPNVKGSVYENSFDAMKFDLIIVLKDVFYSIIFQTREIDVNSMFAQTLATPVTQLLTLFNICSLFFQK
jgi:hypothetical protein